MGSVWFPAFFSDCVWSTHWHTRSISLVCSEHSRIQPAAAFIILAALHRWARVPRVRCWSHSLSLHDSVCFLMFCQTGASCHTSVFQSREVWFSITQMFVFLQQWLSVTAASFCKKKKKAWYYLLCRAKKINKNFPSNFSKKFVYICICFNALFKTTKSVRCQKFIDTTKCVFWTPCVWRWSSWVGGLMERL